MGDSSGTTAAEYVFLPPLSLPSIVSLSPPLQILACNTYGYGFFSPMAFLGLVTGLGV
jgi:hypothetical protein